MTSARPRIVTVVGARPQFVKAAVVHHALREANVFDERLLHTGQHYDANMSDVFFAELGLPVPHHRLNLGGGSHAIQLARMAPAIEDVLLAERPRAVLIYGDTNTTLAAALVAAKLDIPIAHVEAGLRSFDRSIPEEVNRIVADSLSDALFAPTNEAVANLVREGFGPERIENVGDVMYDAALRYRPNARSGSALLATLKAHEGGYALATVHRQDNCDNPERLATIMAAFGEVAREIPIVWPVHPRTSDRLARNDTITVPAGVRLIAPLGYLDMLAVLDGASVVLTDSGGLQKEAFFFGVPCVVLRQITEWIELVELGASMLALPSDGEAIVAAVRKMRALGRLDPSSAGLYGRGDASRLIARSMERRFA